MTQSANASTTSQSSQAGVSRAGKPLRPEGRRAAGVPLRRLVRKPRVAEVVIETLIKTVALVSILAVILILVFVGREALPVLTSAEVHKEVTLRALVVPHPEAGFMWQPVSLEPKYNILPLFLGSLKVTFVALCVAVPLGVAAALFVSELADKRTREFVKPAIELLAGVPSVVIGFFALVVLASWIKAVFGTEHRLNSIVAGIALAAATCPIIFSVSEDAFRTVPSSYRAAALALGSTRSQVMLRVLIPAAAPGIAASVVLGFGRAIGETMIVLLATGNAAIFDASFERSTRTVTATIAQELGEVVVGSAHYHVLFALGALLFLSTLIVNVGAERVVTRMRRRLGVGP
jgi:phosphate transport system permease protein